MTGQIVITLKSDMCAASGDGFSLSIDTDICSDKYGFPYIPSKRLKGCLREAAEYIGCANIDGIFGVSGNDKSGTLVIENARLRDINTLRKQAQKSGYNAEKVLSLFTSVRASTAIENDTAKENSLRFMRVVNRYSPFDANKELIFIADVKYNKENEDEIKRACLALRNIGFKRTRGFGSVRCVFIPVKENKKSLSSMIPDENDDRNYSFEYTVRLDSPVMIPGKNSMETLDYLPGTAVLGALAAKYLANGGDAQSSEFREIFLEDNVIFSDLYISKGNKCAEPAPAVLGKTKTDKSIRTVFRDENADLSVHSDKETPIVKPFKGGYLYGAEEIKTRSETIYHNGKQKNRGKLLYTQECLCEDQLFSGSIVGAGKYLNKIMPLLSDLSINLGRSKTSQYSTCSIVADSIIEITADGSEKTNGRIFAVLCSDVLVLDEYANFSTDVKVLTDEVLKDISDGAEKNSLDIRHSAIRYKSVMGYVSVGRFKKSHIRAFEKGSTLCFNGSFNIPKSKYLHIGERQNEGYGLIKLCTEDELFKTGRMIKIPDDEEMTVNKAFTKLISDEETEKMLLQKAIALGNSVKIDQFNTAFIGRLMLMVSEATDEQDLDARIMSIKTDKKRTVAQKLKKDAMETCSEDWKPFMLNVLNVMRYNAKIHGEREGIV